MSRLERLLSALLTAAAVAVAAVVVKRELVSPPVSSGRTRPVFDAPVYQTSWQDLISIGVQVGDPNAPVNIIEFVDLECPACRLFHRTTLPSIGAQFGSKVSTTFIHFPLPMHRFAAVTAKAAECAAQQGRFSQFIDLTFEKQDSLGLKPWGAFAGEAEIRDTVLFLRCLHHPATIPRIDSGAVVGKRLGINATPTVIVNGWRFASPPSAEELSRVVKELLAGRQPFSGSHPRAESEVPR